MKAHRTPLGLAACALVTLLAAPTCVAAQVTGGAPAATEFTFPGALNDLADQYGVEIAWDAGPIDESWDGGGRTARNAADWELELYAPVLVEELGLYPESFVARSGVRKILLVRDLWVFDEGVNQHVTGTLDTGTGTLYLGVDYTYKVNNRAKQRRVVHHAFFHLVDVTMGFPDEDPEWEALNPDGFHYGDYGRGGQHDRRSTTGLLTTAYPGFLNLYSAGHIADDKADIFAYLMVVHDYVEQRARENPVIRAKVATMKERLAAFSPDMDADFWARVAAIGRDVTPYTIE